MQLARSFLIRFGNAIALIVAVIVLNFILLQLAPGDMAEVLAGEAGGASEEFLAGIRATYGLDKPLHVQLGNYLGKAAQGDLGYSFYYDTPVTSLIFRRLGPTLLLVVTSIIIALILGTFMGVLAARKPDGIFSGFITILSLVGYSMPVFWTAMMLILLFAWIIPIFPISGMESTIAKEGVWPRFLDIIHHLILPAFTLAIIYIAQYSRLARASMIEVLNADFVRTAKAKGLVDRIVVYKHALRNAILPIITIAGLQFGSVISGAVLVETVFNWPGLGTLAFDSILRRDHPTLLGILVFSATIVIIANLITDLCYQLVDPRIKVGRSQ